MAGKDKRRKANRENEMNGKGLQKMRSDSSGVKGKLEGKGKNESRNNIMIKGGGLGDADEAGRRKRDRDQRIPNTAVYKVGD